MSEESEGKHYQATAHRLKELKKKGQFLRSRDLSSGALLIVAISLIILLLNQFYTVFTKNFFLSFNAFANFDTLLESHSSLYRKLAMNAFFLFLPLLLVLLMVPFIVSFAFGGLSISFELIKFKLSRINPVENLKRIFSLQSFVEILKSLGKFLLFFILLFSFIYSFKGELLEKFSLSDQVFLIQSLYLVKNYLFFIIFGILILVLVDMLWSYFYYQKKAKMSLQELKDEQKETEGNPESKKRLRLAQMVFSRQRIHEALPKATVVITNPSHFSIALKYDEKVEKAPKIIAKGLDDMAKEIRLLAVKHSIPIYEAPALARAIYYTGKVGDYIHQELYLAVAAVLAYIMQLKHYQQGVAEKPVLARELVMPKGFEFDENGVSS